MEWIQENGWVVLNGNKQEQRGNNDRLRNRERRSMGESRRIQNRRERVESDHLEKASRKRREGKEQIRRGMADMD
jgi:hypothetical protein